MSSLFQQFDRKIGLGVGLDMTWGNNNGYVFNEQSQSWGVAPATQKFFEEYADEFSYSFSSLQPMPGCGMSANQYLSAFRKFFDLSNRESLKSLHHTFLNLGTLETYCKRELFDFTNTLLDELNISWLNEDVGIWSIRGKSLPYPLPPILTKEGLAVTVKNVKEANSALIAPLLLEFPGFIEGSGFFIGKMNAYDFFYELINRTQNAMTLDTGHILGYQWLRGLRGDDLFVDLDRLPLDHVFEIHLSGCGIINDKFHDFHHGVLLDEQIALLEILLKKCLNLKAITYEDPKFKTDGSLLPAAKNNFDRMVSLTSNWKSENFVKSMPNSLPLDVTL